MVFLIIDLSTLTASSRSQEPSSGSAHGEIAETVSSVFLLDILLVTKRISTVNTFSEDERAKSWQ